MHNKSLAITFSTLIITLNSNILMAAEKAETSILPPYLPLLALVIIIVVFRKQLNCVPAPDLEEKPTTPITEPVTDTIETKTEKEAVISVDTELSATIDLKDGSNQCQASTTKGTRCKRTSSLEEANISIDNKSYVLSVCKQHNTKKLKPFAELIK